MTALLDEDMHSSSLAHSVGAWAHLTEQARSRKKRQDVLVDEADNNSNDERLDEGRHCVAFL